MAWKVFEGGYMMGLTVKGDKSVPATRWWNHIFLLLFRWKMVSVCFANTLSDYQIGYIPQKGKPRLCTRVMRNTVFAVRNGYEDCTFFAVDKDGEEVHLELIEQINLVNKPKNVPLL